MGSIAPAGVETFRGAVYTWDGSKAGTQLFVSGDMTAPAGSGFRAVTFNVPGGVTLAAGQEYVLFATTVFSTQSPGFVDNGNQIWGGITTGANPGVYADGEYVYTNDGNPADLTTVGWDGNHGYLDGQDVAFSAQFGPAVGATSRVAVCTAQPVQRLDGSQGRFADVEYGFWLAHKDDSGSPYYQSTPAIYVEGFGSMCQISDVVTYGGDPNAFVATGTVGGRARRLDERRGLALRVLREEVGTVLVWGGLRPSPHGHRPATISYRSSSRCLKPGRRVLIVRRMDDTAERIATLTRRLALLEQRTADETATIRAELAALQGREPRPATAEPRVAPRPARKSRDLELARRADRARHCRRGSDAPRDRVHLCARSEPRLDRAGRSLHDRRRCLRPARRRGSDHPPAIRARRRGAGGGRGGDRRLVRHAVRREPRVTTCSATAPSGPRSSSSLSVAVWLALAWRRNFWRCSACVTVVIAPPTSKATSPRSVSAASVIAAAAALGLGGERRMAHARRPRLRPPVRAGRRVRLPRAAPRAVRREWLPGHWHHRGAATVIATGVFLLAVAGAAAYGRARPRSRRIHERARGIFSADLAVRRLGARRRIERTRNSARSRSPRPTRSPLSRRSP